MIEFAEVATVIQLAVASCFLADRYRGYFGCHGDKTLKNCRSVQNIK